MITIPQNVRLLLILIYFNSNSSILAHPLIRTVSSFVLRHTQENVQKESTAAHGDTLVIKNKFGSITIEGWSAPRIVMQAVKTGSEKELQHTTASLQKTEKHIYIETIANDPECAPAWVDYTILVPTGMHIQIQQHEGAVTTKKMHGVQKISVDDGDIFVQQTYNNFELSTQKGNVECTVQELLLNGYGKINANGAIEISLPNTIVTDLYVHSSQAYILSSIPISFKPLTTTLDKQAWTRFKQEINGFIGQQGKAYIDLQATRIIQITGK